jgi:lipopolysaccharide heptosyltransferase II
MPDIHRILFVTLSNIGDAILTTPALEALHQAYPTAVVDIVADARSADLFRHCPYVGRIILKHKRSGWAGLWKLVRQLRQSRYDLAVDLRTDGLLWLARCKRRTGKIPNRRAQEQRWHSAEQHFRAIAGETTLQQPPACKIWLSDTERAQAQSMLGDWRGKTLLALGPGANFAGKIWPAENFIALANRLQRHFDAVVLLGNQQEKSITHGIASRLNLPVIDCVGKTDLLTAAAILEQVRVFVGNDSGLGHLAAAVDTPTMTVFGVGQPWRYRPWGGAAQWLQDPALEIANVRVESIAERVEAQLEAARG